MAIDRKYIFDRVSWHLKKETKYFMSGDLHTLIGIDAFRRIAEDIRYPKVNMSAYMTSGQWRINISSDFIKVDETDDIVYEYSGSSIVKITPKAKKLIGRDQLMTASPGIPSNYFMENETTIGFYPPSTSGCIVIPYVQVPTSLSSDADTNQLTERCYQAAVFWSVSQCLLMDDDERYLVYQRLYDIEIARINRMYNEMYEEDKDVIPHEDYLRW